MGKHETGYARVERDLYPTPAWPVTDALATYIELRGTTVWEPACGDGRMVEALRAAGCAEVYATDVVDRGAHQHELFDFLARGLPSRCPTSFNGVVTNPPFGPRGTLGTAFIKAGLTRIKSSGGFLALLLPADFDSAKSRIPFFGKCPPFTAKVVLTRRIVWFERADGVREALKENSAWFVWSHYPAHVSRSAANHPLRAALLGIDVEGIMNRRRLDNRRAAETFGFEIAGLHYVCTIGRFPDGAIAELFLTNSKPGSQSDSNVRDAGIATSLALQHGCPLNVLRRALLRDSHDRPSTPLGVALDIIAEAFTDQDRA
jgi:hypothetical protein